MVDLVDRVRGSCARVMNRARLVTIDRERLAGYDLQASTPTRDQFRPRTSDEVMLVLALDAINFGSGYHDIVRKRAGCSGAVTMSSALTDFVSFSGPLTAGRLRSFSPADCSRIFGQELDGGGLEELMIRFATALRDLGRFLADYGDSGVALVDAADGSAVRLAETLTAMPYYRDVERLDGAEVAFYKRAQITAADLSRRVAPPSGRTELFDDLHRLTAFADNLVPHVLRVDGVLTYEPTLAEQIDARRRLDPGSRPEIELRAAGVQAVELLAEQSGLRPMDIDEILWTRGGAPRYKAVPRHRARSVFY